MKKNVSFLILGMSLFVLGYISIFLFNAFTLWDDLEGMSFWGYPEVTMYDHTIEGDLAIININCPMIITNLDYAPVNITVRNKQKIAVEQIIQAHISSPGEIDDMIKDPIMISLLPRERKTLNWEISQKNQLDFHHIFVRIFLIKSIGQPPYATNHCGVSVINTDRFLGKQFVLGITLGSLASMLIGILLWYNGSSSYMRLKNRMTNLLIAMGTLALISLLINFSGFWLLASLFQLLSLLLILSLIEHRLLD